MANNKSHNAHWLAGFWWLASKFYWLKIWHLRSRHYPLNQDAQIKILCVCPRKFFPSYPYWQIPLSNTHARFFLLCQQNGKSSGERRYSCSGFTAQWILSLANLFFHTPLSLPHLCLCLVPSSTFLLTATSLGIIWVFVCVFVCLLAFNITGEKGKKESKKDSKGDDDETASVTSHESSMVRLQWSYLYHRMSKTLDASSVWLLVRLT